ncbi:MAG TPA: hypothetical protein VM283_04315, partial [Armatimonadota bacterium]|nr:hypothetical protein [Armatimonadota bacterium]
VVTGMARAAGLTEASVFCAYGHEGMHYVVGAFCPADELAGLRVELLEPMMRSFQPGVAVPIEPPGPVAPVQPVEPPGPTVPPPPVQPPGPVVPEVPVETPHDDRPPGQIQVAGDTQPLPPQPGEDVGNWPTSTGPSGYQVRAPQGWTVSENAGRIIASAARGGASVVWWPLSVSGGGSADQLGELLGRLPQAGELGYLTEIARDEGAVLARAGLGGMAVLASYAWAGEDALLVAALAPGEQFEELLPMLRRIAASLQPGTWTSGGQPAARDCVGDRGLLTWQLPPGWQGRGGARTGPEGLSIEIEALLEGDRQMCLSWRQPVRPVFRNLTALLESLGWREGETYADTGGQSGLVVYKRRDPRRFLEDYLLPSHPRKLSDLRIEPLEPDSAIAGLLAGADARGQALIVSGSGRDGDRQRLCLVATALAPPPLVSTCWEAAELRADAPTGELPEAVAALAQMIDTARATTGGDEARALDDLIGRARRALRAIPPELSTSGSPEKIVSVLDGGGQVGRPWGMPPRGLEYWQAGQ